MTFSILFLGFFHFYIMSAYATPDPCDNFHPLILSSLLHKLKFQNSDFRQADHFTCAEFSIHDIREFAKNTALFAYLAHSDLPQPTELKNIYRVNVLPPEHVNCSQSYKSIEKYAKDPQVKKYIDSNRIEQAVSSAESNRKYGGNFTVPGTYLSHLIRLLDEELEEK